MKKYFTNILNAFKSWKHKLAVRVVTAYAKYLFRKAKEKADTMYAQNPQMYYVASQAFHHEVLTIYDRQRFKIEKQAFGCAARLLTLVSLKNGCYYHTPDVMGNQKMSAQEIKRRENFFIYERLRKAGLV